MTLQFEDLSHYQAGRQVRGPALIAKGTEGTTYKDASYPDFKAQAAKLGIPFMGYHWVNTQDLTLQVRNVMSVMADVPIMWDAEASGSTVPRLLDLTTQTRALGGNPCAVYLPHWFWQNNLGSPDLRPLEKAGLYLISSSYPPGGYTEDGPGWNPYGGVTPKQWQWRGSPIDMNAFKGTVDDLKQLWGLGVDMTPAQDKNLAATTARMQAWAQGTDVIQTTWAADPTGTETQWGVVTLKAILAKVTDGDTGDLTADDVRALIAATTLTPPPPPAP